MKIETVPFSEIPLIVRQSITQQTSVNLVDMFKSEIDFKSNPSKTGYICMETNPLPKKIQASLKFSMKFL